MHDIVNRPTSVCMVLEYMEGGDLLTRITSQKALSEQTSKLFFLQMCLAVQYLHAKGRRVNLNDFDFGFGFFT